MITQLSAPALAQNYYQNPSRPNTTTTHSTFFNSSALPSPSKNVLAATEDPLLSAILSAKELPPLDLDFDPKDPALDQDPFFLRSQSWQVKTISGNLDQSETIAATTTDDSVQIQLHLPDQQVATWTVQAPLAPLFQTSHWIIFNTKDTQLFRHKFENSEGLDQGLFFVHRDDLYHAASQRLPTPLFFAPLPRGDWSGPLTALATEDQETLVLSKITPSTKEVRSVAVILSDLHWLRKAELLHHQMALGLAFKNRQEKPQAGALIYPPRGSTAGFGTLFTGIHLDVPTVSLRFTKNESSSHFFATKLAHAGLLDSIDPVLQEKLLRVATVMGASLVGAIALRWTVFKARFLEKDQEPQNVQSSTLVRNSKYVLDVYAHLLTTLAQVPGVLFGNLTEYLADRYLPRIAAGENQWVRKFLNRTVLYVRNSSQQVPVNWKTWFLGSIVLGGIDTLFVGVQLYHVVPAISYWLAETLPLLESRVNEAFQPGNPNTESMNRNELIRNIFGYMTGGASGYSSDLQAQLLQAITPTIEAEMVKQGLNPKDPANKSELDKRIQEHLQKELARAGLPSPQDFLFDFTLIYQSALRLLGYEVRTNSNSDQPPLKLLAEKRPGLVLSALNASIQKLKKSSENNSEASRAALAFLEQTQKNATRLDTWSRDPFYIKSITEWLTDYRQRTELLKQTRQALITLTYEGSNGAELSHIPTFWTERWQEPGVALAAKTYRETFYELMSGPRPQPPGPGIPAYTPPSTDLLGKWQAQKAERTADDQFRLRYRKAFHAPTASVSQVRFWTQTYSRTLIESFGLHPDYQDNPAFQVAVRKDANQATRSDLADPGLQNHLRALDKKESLRFTAHLRALNEIKAYLKATVDDENSDALSPIQPGTFQKIRQTQWLRKKGKIPEAATRFVRSFEAFTSNQSYGPGVLNWIYRNIPFAHDGTLSFQRSLYRMPTMVLATWAFNHFFWGSNIPMSLWVFFLLMGFTIGGPAMMVNRFFQQQGVKPMGSIGAAMIMGVIYSWATFWGSIPTQIFATDFQNLWNTVFGSLDGVFDSAKSVWNSLPFGSCDTQLKK